MVKDKKNKCCEVCEDGEIQWEIKDVYNKKVVYKICSNCLSPLTNCSLSPEQFFNLIKNGHKSSEFLLHGDFYDEETGEALQPI
jgi:hypothetical protein